MKALIAVAAGILGLAVVTPASAADLPLPMKAPPPAPAYNWTGFYVGGNVGVGWGRLDYSGSNTITTVPGAAYYSGSYDTSGIFGGGQAGLNYEFSNNWVIGLEADGEASGISGSGTNCITSGCSLATSKLEDFGTLRGRLGYAWNNLLLYGTGGWAWGSGTSNVSITSGGFTGLSASAPADLSGWAAGAGLEYGLVPNWTVKMEYLHLQFDNVTATFNYGGVAPYFLVGHTTANINLDTVRVGVNYLFNWAPAPIVAKY